MFVVTYKIKSDEVESKIELLLIHDIYNVYYENPLQITTDKFGYGYIEKEDQIINLKVAYEDEKKYLNEFIDKVDCILGVQYTEVEEVNHDYSTFEFPNIHINDDWVIASPEEVIENKNKINFISQGAFGTGLHETTQDILRMILTELNLKDMNVLDIGTGSGILSIASSLAGAKYVAAIDIRDVRDEVELNASLNNLNNVEVFIGDALSKEIKINRKFEWIYINIGGEETQLFMEFIKNHLQPGGNLLVSGLVEWSFNEVQKYVENNGYKLIKKHQTNEWITAIFK